MTIPYVFWEEYYNFLAKIYLCFKDNHFQNKSGQLFVLKTFKFLFWNFGHVSKLLD